jgi:hypothetical protein
MIGKTLSCAALCCSFLCYPSELTRAAISPALLYPFSELERVLFHNTSVQEMESPYSTTSVESFSATKMVFIEKRAYEKLHEHAKNRSQHVATQFSKMHEILPRDCQKDPPRLKEIFIVALAAVAKRHNAALENLKAITDHANPAQIGISERDLMHLLQWSRGITTVLEFDKGKTKRLFIDIALDRNEILIAPKRLKRFIIRVSRHHDQWQKKRFFGSRA